jgi:hypothetical protein
MPELPFLLAGGISIAGGFTREGGWPKEGSKAVIATLALTVIASLTAGTKGAPIVSGLGWLLVLAAVYTAVPAFQPKKG